MKTKIIFATIASLALLSAFAFAAPTYHAGKITKVEKQESQAEAFTELAGESTSLDEEFKKLSTSKSVDDELAELKKAKGK